MQQVVQNEIEEGFIQGLSDLETQVKAALRSTLAEKLGLEVRRDENLSLTFPPPS
jgi:hypothetical protein